MFLPCLVTALLRVSSKTVVFLRLLKSRFRFSTFSWILILCSGSVARLSGRGQQAAWECADVAWKSHHSPVFVINVFRSRLRWRFGCYLRHSLALQLRLWCLITEFYLHFAVSWWMTCGGGGLGSFLQADLIPDLHVPKVYQPQRIITPPIRYIPTNPGKICITIT